LAFSKSGLPFFAFNITGDFDNFGLFGKIEKISQVILRAQKRQTTFWKGQDQESFVVIVSRIVK